MTTITSRMAPHQPSVKGQPRQATNYRSARRNVVRAQIRREAAARKAWVAPTFTDGDVHISYEPSNAFNTIRSFSGWRDLITK